MVWPTLHELQRMQREHDEREWDADPGDPTIAAVLVDLHKLVAELELHCRDAQDGDMPSHDQIKAEVIPDLLICVLRLVNNEDEKLEKLIGARWSELHPIHQSHADA